MINKIFLKKFFIILILILTLSALTWEMSSIATHENSQKPDMSFLLLLIYLRVLLFCFKMWEKTNEKIKEYEKQLKKLKEDEKKEPDPK
jgi:heme/copper-type cytochrome/quinol oxidase subunit 3